MFLLLNSLTIFVSLSVLSQSPTDKISENLKERLLFNKTFPKSTVSAFIYLKDKGQNIESKLLVARKKLSPNSLKRRMVNFDSDNLVSEKDIPINTEYFTLVKAQATKIRHQLKGINAISVEATAESIYKMATFDFVRKIDIIK